MRTLRIVAAAIAVLWAAYITWQTYLIRVEVQAVCGDTQELKDRLGKPPGYDSDLLMHCR
jgi:hypothetical protein